MLASVGPLEIRDYVALLNKSRLVEDCNKKLDIAKAKRDATKKRQASPNQGLEEAPYPKRQFQPGGDIGE